jgi:hypothetical protein
LSVASGSPSVFPSLALADLEGGMRALPESWAGGPALILVGHSGCDTTRFTLPYLDRVHRRRGPGAGVTVVLQDGPDDARALRDRLGLAAPILLEAEPYALAKALDLTTVPTLYQVAPDGRIEAAVEAFQRDALEEAARRLGVEGPLFTDGDRAPVSRPG